MERWPCLNCRDTIIAVPVRGKRVHQPVHLDPRSACPWPVPILRGRR